MTLIEEKHIIQDKLEDIQLQRSCLELVNMKLDELSATPEVQEYLYYLEKLAYYKNITEGYPEEVINTLKRTLLKVENMIKAEKK